MKISTALEFSIRFNFRGCLLLAALLAPWLLFVETSSGAAITLTTSDIINTSSFNTGTNWSDGNAPSAANDYSTTNTLRTPATSDSYTFAGNSLTLNSNGLINFKGTSSSTITINNLYMRNGTVTGSTSSAFTLAGSIVISSGYTGNFSITSGSVGYTVTSSISGAGNLRIFTTYTSQSAYAVTLSGANSYSGGTTVGSNAYLIAASSGALGTGTVSVTGGMLELQSSTSISDSASLIFASTLSLGAVILGYTGAEVVGALSLNGGSTYLSSGTYTVSDLNTLYGSNVFTGAGQIQVIPEPHAIALLVTGGLALFLVIRRFQSRSIMPCTVNN